jgi:hypothetical protein
MRWNADGGTVEVTRPCGEGRLTEDRGPSVSEKPDGKWRMVHEPSSRT